MHRIYLYNSLIGTGTDFLASQLSDDPEFYPLSLRKNGIGLYRTVNPLRYFDIYSNDKLFTISDEVRDKIDNFFSAKSLIVPSSYIESGFPKINLPRLTCIRTQFTTKFSPLFYTMSMIEDGLYSYKLTPNIVSVIDKIDPDQKNEHLQHIKQRNQYYNFEYHALQNNSCDPLKFVKNRYGKYIVEAFISPANCKLFQIDNLFMNPKDNVKEFCRLVGRESLIDYTKIEEFHANQISTLETTFNKTYANYISGNWRDELTEWLQHKCY
jgi:hypothetical protein